MDVKDIKLVKNSCLNDVNSIFITNNINITLLDEHYLGVEYRHKWRCCCGLDFYRDFKSIKKKNCVLCNNCRKPKKEHWDLFKNTTLKKYSSNTIVNGIFGNVINLMDDVYLGASHTHTWKCECGELFDRSYNSIKSTGGYTCYKCTRKIKDDYDNISDVFISKFMSVEEINKYLRKWIKLLDNEYISNSYKHTWECVCGNTFNRTWSAISNQKQTICSKCKNIESERFHKLEVDKHKGYKYIKTYFKGDELPSGEIVNKAMFEVEHEYCGNNYTVRTTSFINDKQRCGNCCQVYENSFAHHIEVELGLNINDVWDFEKNTVNPYHIWKSGTEYVFIKCDNQNDSHDSYVIKCNNYYTGYRCPRCSDSKGEKCILEFLKSNNINNTPQKTFGRLLGLGGGNLSYDFYLYEYNLLIEYQGEQHDKFMQVFHNSYSDFERQQEHDRRKREYAKDNGIRLLEIWYWDFDNIEEILNKEIISNKLI